MDQKRFLISEGNQGIGAAMLTLVTLA